MSEVETVEVHEVARPRLAPVEYVGRVARPNRDIVVLLEASVALRVDDVLIARPAGGYWRTGRAVVLDRVVAGGVPLIAVDLTSITAICEGDHVYRIGKPLTPSLEERVAELERRIYPDLVVADDAEKTGKPEVAAALRAKVEWWRDPEIDWTGIER